MTFVILLLTSVIYISLTIFSIAVFQLVFIPVMPRINLANRNVIVYDGTNNTVVGGYHQFGTTSIFEFFFCLRLFISDPSEFQLYHQESEGYVTREDEGILQTGNYFVASTSFAPSLFH